MSRFGRPGKGKDKGKVRRRVGVVGYARRNLFVPLPFFERQKRHLYPMVERLLVTSLGLPVAM